MVSERADAWYGSAEFGSAALRRGDGERAERLEDLATILEHDVAIELKTPGSVRAVRGTRHVSDHAARTARAGPVRGGVAPRAMSAFGGSSRSD